MSLHGKSLAGHTDLRGNVTNAILRFRSDRAANVRLARSPKATEGEAPLEAGDRVSFPHPAHGTLHGTVLKRLTAHGGKGGSSDGAPSRELGLYLVEPDELPGVPAIELTRSALTLLEEGGEGEGATGAVGEEESRKRVARRAAAAGEPTGEHKPRKHPHIPLPPDIAEGDEGWIPEEEWAHEDYPASEAATRKALASGAALPPDSSDIPRLVAEGVIKIGWPADPDAEEEGGWGKPIAPRPEAGAVGGSSEVGGHVGAGTLESTAGHGAPPVVKGAVAPAGSAAGGPGGGASGGGGMTDVPGARKKVAGSGGGKVKKRKAVVQVAGEGTAEQKL